MNQTIKQLKERKSVRVFTDRQITPQEVSVILEAAVNAPQQETNSFIPS